MNKNLYITYSNQKANEIKQLSNIDAFDEVITLDGLILELFEKNHLETILDNDLASSIVYKIIQDKDIEYFNYLKSGDNTLYTIVDFIIKSKRNEVIFSSLLDGKKLSAIEIIDKEYQSFKQKNNLVDIADIESLVLNNFDSYFTDKYNKLYIDNFKIDNISYIKSKLQENIVKKFPNPQTITNSLTPNQFKSCMIKPNIEVFDNIDEVKTAIRIARKLLEDGESGDEILILASDIKEYAPLYKLFLDEYELKGYSSLGTSINSFHNSNNQQVKIALNQYKEQIKSLSFLYKKLGLTLSDTIKENIKASILISDEKVGIEITEPNQLVGLNRKYKHIIFIGTDINHFPPKANDNFLYSYQDEIDYFYVNNYFTSSQTQLNEMKRLSENLYIVTATYSGKRELSPSILIDNIFDKTIDISNIKSVNQLALDKQTILPSDETKEYYESITNTEFTKYDGDGVDGLDATHLSASQINKYISCSLAYLYSNKIRIKAPTQTEEGFDVMEQGSLMHLCYELFGRYIKTNKIKSIDKSELYEIMYNISLEAYSDKSTVEPRGKPKLEENIHHKIFLSNLQAGLKDDRQLGILAKFVDYYIERADEFNYFQDSEFEKEFALDEQLKPYKLKDKEDTNYFIKGFIDRFDVLENQINIIDYKSKNMKAMIDKEKMEQIAQLKDVQLALYILYASQEYPKQTYLSHLLSFKGDKPYYNFANLSNKDDLKDTELYSDEYEKKLRKLIFKTKQEIDDGKFSFNNGDEKICEWCDIKHICHESVLNNKII